MKEKSDLRIVFMGTPEFAVQSLKKIHASGYDIAAVVTAPDKPAGRGAKLRKSAVKKFAEAEKLPVLQPKNLKSPDFTEKLSTLEADVFIVVAFRMLPEVVWKMPPKGTINLHASLLPNYRGAAPINHVLINGEQETGLTSFFIRREIDTGNIILQKKIRIKKTDNAGSLHDKMMSEGAELLIETLKLIKSGKLKTISQDELITDENKIKSAPKIFKEDCRINPEKPARDLYNFIRGLSPYPSAIAVLENIETEKRINVKIFEATEFETDTKLPVGSLQKADKRLILHCGEGALSIKKIRPQGKKSMQAKDFMNGYPPEKFKLIN